MADEWCVGSKLERVPESKHGRSPFFICHGRLMEAENEGHGHGVRKNPGYF